MTVWSIFSRDSKYFDPSRAGFMFNFRVTDLDGLLAALRAEGVTVDDKREEYDYGRFAWIVDPEGNRIELWEPPAGA
jgi:predicted enzyme related to lactoylglutathione lyase